MNPINEKHNGDGVDKTLISAFQQIILYLGRDDDLTEADRANFADSAVRAAKAFAEMTLTRTQIAEELKSILATGFPRDANAGTPGFPLQGPVQAISYCPHHLLPVFYRVYVAYMPSQSGLVLGISKLARIVQTLAKRPVLQEQLASDIVDVLYKPIHQRKPQGPVGDTIPPIVDVRWPSIESEGSAVLLIGEHSCMSCRGVESDAHTAITELRGQFHDYELEQKFYQLTNLIKSHR